RAPSDHAGQPPRVLRGLSAHHHVERPPDSPDSPALAALNLPPAYLRLNSDPVWLRALPDLLAQLADRWSLTLGPHFPDLSYNYVAPATRADGTPCVLKVSRGIDGTRNEFAALHLWNGNGAAQLIDADPDIGALVL